MAYRGNHFALCCVVDATAKDINHFFEIVRQGPKGWTDKIYPTLILIDDLNKRFSEPTRHVEHFSSPLVGKSAAECLAIVKELAKIEGSDINYEYLAILDERSFQDETVLFVEVPDPDIDPNAPVVGRGYWRIAEFGLQGMELGKPSLVEARGSAEHEGGIIDFDFT